MIGQDFIPFRLRGGWVYLIRNDATGLFKIGETLQPWTRLRDLKRQLGATELTLIHCIFTNDRKRLETHLHKRFASKLLGGEWFYLNAENVLAVMSAAWVRYPDADWLPVDAWRPSKREEMQYLLIAPYPLCETAHHEKAY